MIIKPIIKNYIVYQGTTFILSFIWDIDGYPLTADCEVAMQIRSEIKSPVVICEASTENGKITIDVLEKRVIVEIPDEDTSTFNFEKAVYDIEIGFPNGRKFRPIKGNLGLDLEVTRVV